MSNIMQTVLKWRVYLTNTFDYTISRIQRFAGSILQHPVVRIVPGFIAGMFKNRNTRKSEAEFPHISPGNRIYLAWGKIRRQYLIRFQPEYVRKSIEHRQGECIRCGASCRLLIQCPFLDGDNIKTAECEFYESRTSVCRLYPIDARDLKDRNIVSPDTQCGYWFER